MAACLFSETGGVADILERQLLLLKPLMAVHGTKRLLAGCNQVLVLSLTCGCTSGVSGASAGLHFLAGHIVSNLLQGADVASSGVSYQQLEQLG